MRRCAEIFAGLLILVYASNACAAKEATAVTASRSGKTCRTYYTDERIAVARENVRRYEWARELLDRIMKGDTIRYYIGPKYVSAEQFAAQSDEFMWLLQPTTKIPRHVLQQVEVYKCPIHGWEGRKSGWSGAAWCPWRIDPINHPYKIQCLAGGEWYPSNDYHKGDMTSGPFPDDGGGFVYKGERYYPLREYAHMVYGSVVIPCLRSLSQAYLLTGDEKYAHKGAVLLARLASEYPNHDDRRDRLYDTRFLEKRKGARTGMITDYIWECFCFEAAVYAYDALYDFIGNDAGLLSFVKSKGLPVDTGDDLRRYIEDYLIRAGMKALLIGGIRGNEGHHQAAAMAAALVLDDFTPGRVNSQDMVDYFYYGIGRAAYILTNDVTPDGGGHESPNYNRIKLDFIRAAKLMEELRRRHPDRFPKEKYPDIFDTPKARALFDYFIDCFMLDYYVPSIGDCAGITPPRRVAPQQYSYRPRDYLFAFERYGDPRYARACTKPNGEFVAGDLFEPYPEEALKAALARPESVIVRKPRIKDDYGMAILESGSGAHRRAVYLNYVSPWGHRQSDHLAIGLVARGVDLLPDLGYPLTYYYRWTWDCNSFAHNTVTVDETQPQRTIGGMGRLFASVDGVHVVTASHDPYPPDHKPYPAHFPRYPEDAAPCDLYERTLILIDVAPERFYVVDLFAVRGGTQHDQSWHSMLTPVSAPDLDWKVQETGTLAGPDVEQFGKWKDRWGRQREDFPSFLAKIRRARLDRPAVWTWRSGLPEGDALALHVVPLGGAMEVIQGSGRAPSRPDDWWLDYVICRRLVDNGARSLFLSVLDGYQGRPVVKSVELIGEDPVVVRVLRDDGEDEITLHVPEGPSRTTAPRALGVRVRMRSGAGLTRDVRIGACDGEGRPGYATSAIRDVDYERCRIAVQAGEGESADFAVGRAVRIFNDHRSALYIVRRAERRGELLWLTLDRTALLARLPITGVQGESLRLGVVPVFANGRVDEKGNLQPAHDAYRGSWFGDGKHPAAVRAIASRRLFFEKRIPAPVLKRRFEGKTVSLWQYAVGDRIEAARIEH